MNLHTMFSSLFKPAPRVTPADYGERIRAGEVLLVDAREPDEWSGGVAESAALLPFSDLRGSRRQWSAFLKDVGQREVLIYCATGMRSGIAARVLEGEGIRAKNAGGLSDWSRAGWEIVAPNGSPRAASNVGSTKTS